MSQLIGFAGYARAGKDVMADALMRRGAVRVAFGDTIKAYYRDFLARRVSLTHMTTQLHADRSSDCTAVQMSQFIKNHLVPTTAPAITSTPLPRTTSTKA